MDYVDCVDSVDCVDYRDYGITELLHYKITGCPFTQGGFLSLQGRLLEKDFGFWSNC